ncbi:hypothetical protein C0V70_04295 [Bacteriovorax stolpii]|uniref:Uncharacterized protein n=2 Tax=Bacteriovorax stolpii TaxID=960 RepID=A0A2K9NPB3_BACTC|nr:hypothetical protein C0V70_04295 [Bacteriovorax stolpii]
MFFVLTLEAIMNNTILTLACLMLFASCSTMNSNEEKGRLLASDEGDVRTEVIAKTTKATLNGKKLVECSLILEEVRKENQEVTREISFQVIGEKEGLGRVEDTMYLYEMNEAEKVIKMDQYKRKFVANSLTEEQKKNGYSFESSAKKISFSNGDRFGERDSFEIQLEEGNINRVKKLEYKRGASSAFRTIFAIPKMIFGGDLNHIDLKCVFE